MKRRKKCFMLVRESKVNYGLCLGLLVMWKDIQTQV